MQKFLKDLLNVQERHRQMIEARQKEQQRLRSESIKHEKKVQSNQMLRLKYEPDRAPPSLQKFAKAEPQSISSSRPQFNRGW